MLHHSTVFANPSLRVVDGTELNIFFNKVVSATKSLISPGLSGLKLSHYQKSEQFFFISKFK